MSLFLSSIIIHKTVKYSADKYFEIILDLIEFYSSIKSINYGLEDKMVEEFRKSLGEYNDSFS